MLMEMENYLPEKYRHEKVVIQRLHVYMIEFEKRKLQEKVLESSYLL